ncbi:2OG-Fe(II) oxygenase [Kitasatospora sp. NBC_01250]|uniref:2OG-Fe(II) oxygenase family protein n=1 Tax=Kitasatospora sp. NBC_01250 TaxID=2903571 RepID=UPI002E33140C|nr:2OG-Fe(II) oxygenase family protein [Kitasatospora sp. NBC_01250]
MIRIEQEFEQITEPFAIHLAHGVLTDEQIRTLFATAPVEGYDPVKVTDPDHDKQYAMQLLYLQEHNEPRPAAAGLSPAWAELLASLRSEEFVGWLERGTGLQLRELPTDIAIYTYRSGDFISVHKDKPYKAITAILYLNPEWPADGGGDYEVRSSADPSVPPVRRIPPTGGQLLAFPPSEVSWHSVSAVSDSVDQTRLTVQLEFWLVDNPKRRY